MLLTPNPKERDSATAYRECRRACGRVGGGSSGPAPRAQPPCCMLCPRDDLGDGGDADGSHHPRTHRVWCTRVPQVQGGHAPRGGGCLPQRGECPGCPEPLGPRFQVTSLFEERFSPRSLHGCLGAQLCPPGSFIPSPLLTLSPCPPSFLLNLLLLLGAF